MGPMYAVGFRLGSILGPLLFLVVGIFLVRAIWIGIKTRQEDRNAPVLTVQARVGKKWELVTSQNIPNGGDAAGAMGYQTIHTTLYRAAFRVQSGDELEFAVSETEYSLLEEGREGALTFQGSRYLGFKQL